MEKGKKRNRQNKANLSKTQDSADDQDDLDARIQKALALSNEAYLCAKLLAIGCILVNFFNEIFNPNEICKETKCKTAAVTTPKATPKRDLE